MYETIIALATPVFFALIAIELFAARVMRRPVYRLNDAITSIGLGAFSQVIGALARLLIFGIYGWVWQHAALLHWPAPWSTLWWALPVALLFYDFCYYWHHRWMHEIAIAWAAHVVHHSSEDYNLSTALRQSASGPLLGWIPYLPMALAGVPPSLFVVVALIDLLYQFWIHTELIGRLGWFDRVFASPSNHRVHHAVNDRYVDRNYGGMLILWDRLFGSFEDERSDDPPVYGTRVPLRSFNPLHANLEVYGALWRSAAALPRWRDRLAIWLRHPGWLPADAPNPGARFDWRRRTRFDPQITPAWRIYALAQFAIVLAMTVHFGPYSRQAPLPELLLYIGYITWALIAVGAALEGRRRLLVPEIARHLLTAGAVLASGAWFGVPALAPMIEALIMLASLASLGLLAWIRRSPAPAARALGDPA